MRFNDSDLLDIQRHIDCTRAYLASLGLSLHVSADMRAFKEFLLDQEQTHGVPSTHDPDRTYLHPENSFWTYLTTDSGRIVACHAQRLDLQDDFIEACRTHTAFGNLVPNLDHYNLDLYEEARNIRISGRVLVGGGLWIHPEWRGNSLLIFNRTNRAIALRHFAVDWFVGFLLNTNSRHIMAIAADGAAYAHAVPLLKGLYPPHGIVRDIQIAYSSRDEALQTIRQENLKLAKAA